MLIAAKSYTQGEMFFGWRDEFGGKYSFPKKELIKNNWPKFSR